MANYCTQCGKEITDGEVLCPDCANAHATEPVSVPPAPPVHDPATAVAGTGSYFGFIFLFGIPVIGWLICLIMCFAPRNKNLKHFARAKFIWILIGVAFAVLLFFAARWAVNFATEYLDDILGGSLGEITEMLNGMDSEQLNDILNAVNSGDLSGIIGSLGEGDLGQILDNLGGEELGQLLGNLDNEQLNQIIGSMSEDQQQQIITAIGGDELGALSGLTQEEIDFLLSQMNQGN